MPSLGRFLEMIEAISRRDWKAIEKIGKAAANDEREKKHYQVAHKISEAIEIAISTSGIEDSIVTVASPLKFQSEELKYNVKFCSICYAEYLQKNCCIIEEIKE
ncbi:MAG TPA: hypothetical protein VNF93_02420 [Buchnera sp. (in: enterobacteria)]|nr:hypothetical protein [Buchnera sp. (in: enterobacteria)]